MTIATNMHNISCHAVFPAGAVRLSKHGGSPPATPASACLQCAAWCATHHGPPAAQLGCPWSLGGQQQQWWGAVTSHDETKSPPVPCAFLQQPHQMLSLYFPNGRPHTPRGGVRGVWFCLPHHLQGEGATDLSSAS